MRTHGLILLCAGALLACGVSTASAQLVFGSTSTSTSNPCAMYLDVNTMQVTTLWNSQAQKKVNGMAADPDTGRLYTNDAARLSYWNYGSIGVVPTLIAGMYRTNDHVAFTATGVDGMAFAHGQLYGTTSYPGTTYKRGIYQIDTVSDGMPTPHCVMTELWRDPTASDTSSGLLTLGGLEFNAADNLFYAANSVDATPAFPYTPGLYSIDAFGTGAMVRVADFPAGRTHIDGLAIGGGRYWLTEQVPGTSSIDIYPYDPVTGLYDDTIHVPLTDATQRATGAAWAPGALVPEPSTLGALALLALAGLRRRA